MNTAGTGTRNKWVVCVKLVLLAGIELLSAESSLESHDESIRLGNVVDTKGDSVIVWQ